MLPIQEFKMQVSFAIIVLLVILAQARPGIDDDPDNPDEHEIVVFPTDHPAPPNVTTTTLPTAARQADVEYASYLIEIISGCLAILVFLIGIAVAVLKYRRQVQEDPAVILPALRGLAVAILALLQRMRR